MKWNFYVLICDLFVLQTPLLISAGQQTRGRYGLLISGELQKLRSKENAGEYEKIPSGLDIHDVRVCLMNVKTSLLPVYFQV